MISSICYFRLDLLKSVNMSSKPVAQIPPKLPSSPEVSSESPLKPDDIDRPACARAQAHEIIEGYLLIWIDAEINETLAGFGDSMKELRRTFNTIEIFRKSEECLEYVSSIKDQKIFLIVSENKLFEYLMIS